MEVEPLIAELSMVKAESDPFLIYNGSDILLLVSGIGKASAAMGTAYCCIKYQPSCILNCGAAGAVDDKYEVGSIFQVEKTIEPDRPHLRSNTPWIQVPDTLEGFNNAVLATQDRPVNDIETFGELAGITDLVDMEGASILQAAKKFNAKCHIFKFVSDTPSHAGKGLIMDNIKTHVPAFTGYIKDSVIPLI